MRTLYTLTVFASAFLLFMIQPMLAKMLLPEVGGAAAVWIVAMLFFQLMLLLGYSYAALGNARLQPHTQARLHIVLMVLAVIFYLPLSMPGHFDLSRHAPETVVIGALFLCIGLPYFMLAAHNSLLQRWYFQRFGTPPYTLFAVSNAGSFAGLLGYPLAVEWLLPLSSQRMLWSVGFCVLLCMIATLAMALPRREAAATPVTTPPMPTRNILWVILFSFVPSSLFLSTTLYATTDIASFPLLWVVPLALYLLSFIIAFMPSANRVISWAHTLHPLAVVGLVLGNFFSLHMATLAFNFTFFFIVALSCHGCVARLKPEPTRLGMYYLWLSVGGALGGVLGVIAPHLFNDIYEYYAVAILSLLAVRSVTKLPAYLWIALLALLLISLGKILFVFTDGQLQHQSRNFFGISRVITLDTIQIFRHGTTLHGIQSKEPASRLAITSYYTPMSKLVKALPQQIHSKPFGIVGLGAGTMVCLGTKGQKLDVFEIDHDVVRIASNPEYFTYLRDCPPATTIIEGDGRVSIAKQPDQKYNLLVMDAFTSDAVPVHMLTTEAVALYIRKLDAKTGILALHLSNRHLALEPLSAAAIREAGWQAYFLTDDSVADDDLLLNKSHWVFALPPGSPWRKTVLARGAVLLGAGDTRPWSDDYSNILDALRR